MVAASSRNIVRKIFVARRLLAARFSPLSGMHKPSAIEKVVLEGVPVLSIQRNRARGEQSDKFLIGLKEIVIRQHGVISPLKPLKYQILQRHRTIDVCLEENQF